MFFTIVIVLLGALAGAWFRYLARDSRRPWLVTAVLAAVAVALFALMPPGQELFAIWGGILTAAAAGAAICAIVVRSRQ